MPIAQKDNQYDYSRMSTFLKCPRKHSYIYHEGILSGGNKFTIPGTLFHECVRIGILIRNSKIPSKDGLKLLDDMYTEFDKLCTTGEIEHTSGTLKYIVEMYFKYYDIDYAVENTLLLEHDFEDSAEDDDVFVGRIDQVYEYNEVVTLRDIKTTANKLKYTYDSVKMNQQLLFYVPFAEDELHGTKIDAIEIDEVRIARLEPVPIMKNGQPSRDKKLLELVTYEDYYEELNAQGLFGNQEYQHVLQWLKERGHPLFRRIKVQLVDEEIVNANIQDMYATYQMMNKGKSMQLKPRIRGPLCQYCEYKDLCEIDMFDPDSATRQIYIDKITKNT